VGGAAEKTRDEGGMWGVWEGAVYFFDSLVAVGGGAVMKLYVYVWGVERRGWTSKPSSKSVQQLA